MFAVTPFTFAVTPFTFAALVGKRVVPWRRDDVPSPRSGRTFALVTPQSPPTRNCRGLPANYTPVFPEPVLVQQGARGVRFPANYSILACIYMEIKGFSETCEPVTSFTFAVTPFTFSVTPVYTSHVKGVTAHVKGVTANVKGVTF